MTVYATRLVNGTDTRERMRRADALGLAPAGPGLARGGLRNDGGGVVTVNAGTMTVDVTPFTGWVDGGVSDLQGGYTFVSDSTETLTVANGDASQSRTDVVIAEVRDTTHDGSGSTDARVRILQGTPGAGTPALPTSALALRNIVVPAGASAGTGGLSAGAVSTDRRTYTSGLGGVLTVANQAERDALPGINGTPVYRADLDRLETRTAAGWVPVSPGQWVSHFNNPTYDYSLGGSLVTIPEGGPHTVYVPAGRTLDLRFTVPLLDLVANSNAMVALYVNGTEVERGFWSNSSGSNLGMPINLEGAFTGTGANVTVEVRAQTTFGLPRIKSHGGQGVKFRTRVV